MAFTTRNYEIRDKESGLQLTVVPNVASGRMAGAELANGSPVVTLSGAGNTTEGLWPGMLVVGKGIPADTIVLSIDGSTSFTLSESATATLSGLVLVARGYLPEITTKNLNIEHYRDLFGGSTAFDCGGALSRQVSMEGVGFYITTPTFSVFDDGFNATQGRLIGTPNAAVSDNINHTPPREQTQKVSFVLFVCDDGALVPMQVFPNTLIAQEAQD